MLVHILLEPGTVEKQCDGRGKALCKGWERKVLQLSLLLLPGFCSGQQCVVNGAWSRIVAVINKAHIFFFANIFFICITFTDDRAIILWESVLSLSTLITKCKKRLEGLRAWIQFLSPLFQISTLSPVGWSPWRSCSLLGVGCRAWWSRRNTQMGYFLHRCLLPVSRIVANSSVRMKLCEGTGFCSGGRVFQRGFFLVSCLHGKLFESNGWIALASQL